jgi:hypothetical protein
MNPTGPHIIVPETAQQVYEWLMNRGGIYVWNSADLSDPDISWTTPADVKTKPSWKSRSEPSRKIIDPAEVVVIEYEVAKRFHVAVRMGAQGLSIKVTDGGSRRIRRELSKVENATYTFDYGSYENAVILKPKATVPLLEWMKQEEKI